MKTTITLAFDGERAEELARLTRSVDLGTLLRDALGEFRKAREPVEEYVVKRYGEQVYTGEFRRRKVSEVHKRLQLADALRRGDITIEVSGDTTDTCARTGCGKARSWHLGLGGLGICRPDFNDGSSNLTRSDETTGGFIEKETP